MPFYWYKGLPDCTYDLETLEKIILKRYEAYNDPNTSCIYDFHVNSIDSVGHLFMCIIANEAVELKPLIIKGELKLFIDRLTNRSVDEIKNDFSLLLDVLNFNKSNINLKGRNIIRFTIIDRILKTISSRIDHVFHVNHKEACRKFKLTLPFYMPLSLIAKREIEVRNGTAEIYCSKWKNLLEDIFKFLLQVEMAAVNNCPPIRNLLDESEDDRIRQIIQRCFNAFVINSSNQFHLNSKDAADEESRFFPPCMANLHQILRRTHRLSYDSRYQYTLFLKDAGLNVDENISFWEEEYSKPHCSSNCTHHWEEKKKRYMYQIRHIYGLTGAFSDKTSHSCDKFTHTLSFKMDGGCPFVHLNKNELINSLPVSSACSDDIEDILNFKESNQPQKACAAYLGYQENILRRKKNLGKINNIRKINEINRPVDYYFLAKNISSRIKESSCDEWL